jgi:PAS domain S-box-containing protein
LGATEQLRSTHRQFVDKIHPDDRSRFTATISALTPDNPTGIVTFRVVNPNGGLVWLRSSGHGIFDNQGRLRRVIGMVADVTDLKLAEEKLRASEERLRLAQWAARIGTFDLNMRTGVNVWTPETEAMYGLPPGTFGGTLAAFENLIHPDDRERMIDLTRDMVRTGQPVEGEWRVVWPDGSVRWIAGRGQVLMDEYGEPSRMLGVNLDITERKRAEETLAGMTRKLIESQEKDRARIGRDLHDDINQQLALLAVQIDQMRHNPRVSVAQFRSRLGEVRDRVSEVASEVQSISHQLHSPQLEILGIVGAIRSLCKEYAARQKVTIDFTHDYVPENVARDISLCLFPVLQEALHNAVKHSNVRHYEVRLGCSENALHLTVSDRGTGFDAEAAMRSEGLGLVSMRERVRLVDGTIAIESSLMGGTTINVRVPFTSEIRAERCVS